MTARRRAARHGLIAACPVALALLSLAVLPGVARADVLDGVKGLISEWLVTPAVNWLLARYLDCVKAIATGSALTSPFAAILGDGSRVWALAQGVCNTLVRPLAHTLLSVALVVQLLRVAGRANDADSLPMVREVVSLVLFATLFTWLVNNSDRLCVALYDEVVALIRGVGGSSVLPDVSVARVTITDPGALVGMLVLGVVVFLVGMVAYVVSVLMVLARGLQLYVYAMLSPLPMALLAYEETRQVGIGFLRNFLAQCLAGLVMAFALVAFPAVLGTFAADLSADWSVAVTAPLKVVALTLLLCLLLVRSGSIARDVLGG